MPSLLRSSLWGPIKVPRRSEIIQQLGDERNQTGTIVEKRGAVDAPFHIVTEGMDDGKTVLNLYLGVLHCAICYFIFAEISPDSGASLRCPEGETRAREMRTEHGFQLM